MVGGLWCTCHNHELTIIKSNLPLGRFNAMGGTFVSTYVIGRRHLHPDQVNVYCAYRGYYEAITINHRHSANFILM